MDLNTAHTVAEAERIIRDLEGSGTDFVVKMATNSRAHVGGGEAAIVQALITWAQNQEVARLATYVAGIEGPQIRSFTEHLAGLCAGLLCDEATTRGGQSIKIPLREAALSRLRILQGPNPNWGSRGPQLEIISADHLNRPYPTTLYDVDENGTGLLRSESVFRDIGRLIFKRAIVHVASVSIEPRLVSAIGDALYELFRNTDEHARTDINGDHLRRSIRGIHARRHALLPEDMERAASESPHLLDYFRRRRPRAGRRHVQMAEFSVFDSGPGLASRWLGRSVEDPAEEKTAVEACFERHKSTKQLKGRGMGLPIVIAALRERGGFLRVRTGRLSLFADLAGQTAVEFGTPPDLRPWSDRRNLPPAAGTLFTFLLPLEDAP
jgi:hypothetical protein